MSKKNPLYKKALARLAATKKAKGVGQKLRAATRARAAKRTEKRFDKKGMRLTDCCGAFSTYSEGTLCCKKCYKEVSTGEGDGTETRTSVSPVKSVKINLKDTRPSMFVPVIVARNPAKSQRIALTQKQAAVVQRALDIREEAERISEKFPKLDLKLPDYKHSDVKSIRESTSPTAPALEFLRAYELAESKRTQRKKGGLAVLMPSGVKAQRELIAREWKRCFACPVPADVSLEILKAKIVYRLQYEGFRCAGVVPAEKFLYRYVSVMSSDKDPFGKFDGATQWVAKRLAIQEEYTMSKKQTTPKAAKASNGAQPANTERKPRKGGVMVLDTYSATAFVRYLHKKGLQTVGGCNEVLEALGAKVNPVSISTALSDQRSEKYKKEAPKLAPEHVAKTDKLIEKAKTNEKDAIIEADKKKKEKATKKEKTKNEAL